jgi:predicted Zn-dependent peptidase
MLISSGIDTSNKDIAKDAILEQINDIKNGKITDTEFSAAKKSLINCYRQIYDNPLEIQAFFGGRSLFEIGETIDECIENIMSVDIKGVVAIANNTRIIAEFFVEGNASDTSSMEEEEVYEE